MEIQPGTLEKENRDSDNPLETMIYFEKETRLMISVIAPAHNAWGFLRRGAESILGQVYPDSELLPADDGFLNL